MKLVNYLTARAPGQLDTSDQLRVIIGTFAATAASVAAVHQFIPGGQQLGAVITHSAFIATTYVAAAMLVGGLLFLLTRRTSWDAVEVWQLWVLSFLVYNLGYFLDIPFGDASRVALHPGSGAGDVWLNYTRLIPIWALVTYVFIEARTRPKLVRAAPSVIDPRIEIVSGKRRLRFASSRVSHIEVQDHYCYFHYRDDNGWRKTDVARPLGKVLECVPASFVRVHRSYVVNPVHVERIERDGRSYRLVLINEAVVPLSRHRLTAVLPRLRARSDSK